MSDIVVALVCGLPSYVLVKVLEPGYFSRGDTRTPVMTAATALSFNIFLNLMVVRQFGIVGLAGATAASASLNCVLLYINLHRRGHFRFDWPLLSRVLRQIAAALVMAAALYYLLQATLPWYSGTVLQKGMGIVMLVSSGFVIYALVAWAIGAVDKQDLALLARRRNSPPIDDEIPGF